MRAQPAAGPQRVAPRNESVSSGGSTPAVGPKDVKRADGGISHSKATDTVRRSLSSGDIPVPSSAGISISNSASGVPTGRAGVVSGVPVDRATPMKYCDALLTNKDKEWTTAGTKKKNQSNSKKTPSIIYGRATNSIIKSAFKRKSNIYLGDIDTTVSISDITDYLSGAGIKVIKVYCISSVSSHTKSFKLSVSSDDYDKVFNPDLWEEGTRVREWGAHGRPLK